LSVSYSIKTNAITKLSANELRSQLDKALNNSSLYTDIVPNIQNSSVVTSNVVNHALSSEYIPFFYSINQKFNFNQKKN